MKSYAVIGLGRFGAAIAVHLDALGNEVLAVDQHEDLVQQIAGTVSRAVVADAADQEVLRALGVGACDCAVVAIGDDLAASVMATMNLRELGVPYIVCKAYDEAHRKILMKLGADKVVIPEQEVAVRLAHSLASSNVLEYIELSRDYGIVETETPKAWRGKSLLELNVRAKYGVTVIAARSADGIRIAPAADYIAQEGDVLVVLGDNKALSRVQKL